MLRTGLRPNSSVRMSISTFHSTRPPWRKYLPMNMVMDMDTCMRMVTIWNLTDMIVMYMITVEINITTEKGPRNIKENRRNQRDGARGNIERLSKMRNTGMDMDVAMARGWSMMKMSSNIMSEMALLTELL